MPFDDFDARLRSAFRHEEPPAGFAERTMARIASGLPEGGQDIRKEGSSADRGPRLTSVRALAVAAAALLLIAFGAGSFRSFREDREAERARRDVEVALRVASTTLNEVRLKLAEASARSTDVR